MGDIFLSEEEQIVVQKLYSTFLSDVRPEMIVPRLFSNQTIEPDEKQKIESERTYWAKNDRLYEIVLSRATYPNVCAMRDALLDSRDANHARIAEMLPERQSNRMLIAPNIEAQPGHHLNINSQIRNSSNGQDNPHSASVTNPILHAAGRSDGMNSSTQRYQNHSSGHNIPSHLVTWRQPNRVTQAQGNQPEQHEYAIGHSAPFGSNMQEPIARNGSQSQLSGMWLQQQQIHNNPVCQENLSHYISPGVSMPNAGLQGSSNMRSHVYPINASAGSIASGAHFASSYSVQNPTASFAADQNGLTPTYQADRRAMELDIYKSRVPNNRIGRGLCAIISNFTGDLPGYRHDVEAIKRFFEEVLNYQVLCSNTVDTERIPFQNLNRKEFFTTLTTICEYLNQPFSEVDRFVLFVLSHGDQHGIKTCADKRGRADEGDDDANQPIRIKAQDIVHMFTHDKVPSLYEKPKCFFLQHCRGPETVRSAGRPTGVEPPNMETLPPMAVGADTALFYATDLGCQSYVTDERGSWYISETVRLMRQFHDKEHLVDIMGRVNRALSIKSDQQQNGMPAHQMPSIVSSLTNKFYLTVPDNL